MLLEDELNHGPLDENLNIDYMKQMSCGLKHLHGLNIAHRDLKRMLAIIFTSTPSIADR